MMNFSRDEHRESWRRFTRFHLLSTIFLFAFNAVAQERIGTTTQPLITEKGVQYWTSQNNTVPVCWETAGYDREKKITQEAVAGTWSSGPTSTSLGGTRARLREMFSTSAFASVRRGTQIRARVAPPEWAPRP